jgi:hypothetical protein
MTLDFRTAGLHKGPASDAPEKEGARWTPGSYLLTVILGVAFALCVVAMLGS